MKEVLHKLTFKKIFFKFVFLLCLLLGIPIILWNLTFGFYVGYLLLGVAFYSFVISFQRFRLRPLFYGIVFSLLLYVLFLPLTMQRMNHKTANYQERVLNGGDLSFIEKYSIYGCSAAATILAYPLFPEVSKEFFYMFFPSSKKVRYFESDFFMDSKILTTAFEKSNKGRVRWFQKHYKVRNPECRVALALNICNYTVTQHSGFTNYEVRVPVRFPKQCRSTFFSSDLGFLNDALTIRLEEGLFRYLEEEGWLFGYDAIWRYSEKR